MNISVDTFGSRLLINGIEIAGFRRIGKADGMTIIMRLDARDPGQKALAAASVSAAPHEFTIIFKDQSKRQFLAVVSSCEMEDDDLRAALAVEPSSIMKAVAWRWANRRCSCFH